VEWGTILEKLNHNYAIVGKQFVCIDEGCGEVYESGTGIFEMNGDLYYSINDVLQKGWQTADEGYCYAGSDYKLYIGEQTVSGITYVFDENGSTKGAWTTNANGTRYSYGPGFYSRMWVEIEGKAYYFGRDSYMYTGIRFVKDNPDVPAYWYDFGEDGATDRNATVADGLYEVNGDHYIVVDGETKSGIYEIDGAYYLGGIGSGFERYGYIAKNTTMSVSGANTNGVIPSGVYTFGADGKMVINHGVVGNYFYDENGFMVHAYKLVELDGDYYFINDGNKVSKNKTIYLSGKFLEGTDFKAGYFEFGADGKMVLNNGPMDDGFFYIKGVKQQAYQLIEFEGDYYFINDGHKYAANKTIYLTSRFLAGTDLKPGYYTFGADGKMIIE
jgi:glucan-binding YG repeat protein